MFKYNFIILIFGIVSISSCTNNTLDDDKSKESDIDDLVNIIMDTAQVYDISQSMRFTKDKINYDAVGYYKGDSIKLLVSNSSDIDSEINRQFFINNDNELTFVNEFGTIFQEDEYIDYEKKIYFFNNTKKTYYKDLSIKDSKFVIIDDTVKYSISKSVNALEQTGEFEMKFGEFLIIEPQTYLILDNKISNYSVALFITQGDFLLDELYTNPEKYKRETIFANHEFSKMNGITRMIYKGGFLIQKE